MTRALVVGFGSIGQRHARVLEEIGGDVAVVSRRQVDHPRRYSSINAGLDAWAPDYVVVASRTMEHAGDLAILARSGFSGTVLMEKPLFGKPAPVPSNHFAALWVAYNLRFHPVIAEFRRRLLELDAVALFVTCGSYLPNWRPGGDYRKGYSAIKAEGGGVLRDLSHEIDYALWMAGGWTRLTASGGHLSQLEIDSDDVFSLIIESPRIPLVTVSLDYIDTRARRTLTALTRQGTLFADVMAGTVELGGQVLVKAEVARDDTYIAQHRAILSGDGEVLCSLEQGLAVVAAVDAAEHAAAERRWLER